MRTRLCAGLATLCLLAPAAHAEDRPLVWAVSELHGLINLEQSDAESRLTGVVGRLQERLLSTLPETEVRPVLMSVPRMQRELQARDNVCTGIFLRTPERERFLVFSRPYLVISDAADRDEPGGLGTPGPARAPAAVAGDRQ